MPTCPRPSKKTRSPGWRSLRGTAEPMPYWAYELCGRPTPAAANAYITRPEQSNPDGLAPPQRYGTPRYCIATATARAPTLDGGGAAIGDVFTGAEPLDDDDPALGAAGSVGAIACAAAVCCC